jgi:hypothetical protein
MRASHEPSGIDLRPSQFRRDIAPIISSLRMSDCPALEVRPSRSLPPEENWRGTRPSQAAKSRPHRKLSIGGAKASTARAVKGLTPGMVCRCRVVSASAASALIFPVRASMRTVFSALFQQISAFLEHQIGQVAVGRIQNLCDPLDLMDSPRNNVAVFIEARPQCVDQFGAMMDKPFSGAKQNCPALLLF